MPYPTKLKNSRYIEVGFCYNPHEAPPSLIQISTPPPPPPQKIRKVTQVGQTPLHQHALRIHGERIHPEYRSDSRCVSTRGTDRRPLLRSPPCVRSPPIVPPAVIFTVMARELKGRRAFSPPAPPSRYVGCLAAAQPLIRAYTCWPLPA